MYTNCRKMGHVRQDCKAGRFEKKIWKAKKVQLQDVDKARIEKVDPTFVNASIMSRNEMQDVAKATLSLQKPLNSGNSNLFMEENQSKGPSSFSNPKSSWRGLFYYPFNI